MFTLRSAALGAFLLLGAGCGGGYTTPAGPAPTPAPSPTPAPTPTPSPSPGATSAVAIVTGAATLGNRAYNPADVTVDVGSTVTWTNADREAHTTTSNQSGWNSGAIAPGAQFSFTYQTAGTFPYHCTIHPGMTGTVTVH
jgi:plastocyanin